MNIVLFGFMGTGKSAISKKLADVLHQDVCEMDELIEKQEQMPISTIFKEKGESHFRQLERDLVKKLSKEDDKIISTGGGVILNEKNIIDFKKNGILISLMASPEAIYQRVKDETHRPLLKTKDPLKTIQELLDYRNPFYEKAPYHIDTSNLSINEVVDKILKIIEDNKIKNS